MPRKSFFALWKQYRAYLTTTIFLFICVVSFQNCTPELGLEEGSEDSTSLSDTTPFAFDISIDHFAMMSCNAAGLNHSNQNGQFTYKWGAFQNGLAIPGRAGLRLSDNFMSKYGRNVPGKIFTVLDESQKNKNLEIVSGLYIQGEYLSRKTDDKTAIYRNNHSKLQVNFYTKDLSLNPDKTLAYFPDIPLSSGASTINRNIEGVVFRRAFSSEQDLRGYKDEFTALINFDQLMGYPLTIGFGHSSELARGEAKSLVGENGGYQAATAIGRSYRPQIAGIKSSHLRYLSGITEGSLDGSQVSSSWACPSSLRFKIIQRKDMVTTGTAPAGKFRCNPRIVSSQVLNSSTLEGKGLRSLANVLDFGLWEVDYARKCIVRRRADDTGLDNCYSDKYNRYINSEGKFESVQANKVDYSSNQGICTSSNPIRDEPFVTGGPDKKTFYMCSHYVSVCVKTN